MKAPDCNLHGRLVLDLARGRLGDAEADRADTALASCAACRSWWQEQLEDDEAAVVVDEAVSEAVVTFHAHRARRRAPWLAAAAAAAIVVSATMLWQARHDRAASSTAHTTSDMVEQVFAPGGAGAAADLNGDGVVDASDLALALQARPERPTPQA